MQKAGKYEILRKIGAGGFGVVYEGRDPFIKRRVAIKTCTSEDEDIRQRFFREAEIAGNLQHRNIVTIHDFGFEEGVPYLVQEFLPGEDLSQMIARRDPIPLGRKLDLLLQTAHGMAFAHSQGVIHRDIKPNNVRVLEDWRVKIMDFGIAKLANVESHLTKEGMTVGTAAYLPPEQIRGDKVDTRADIFSYGVLAYELLTYTRPFDGKTLSTLLYQILSQEPKPLLEVWPEAPPRVAKLVSFCLEKDPAKRCPTFDVAERELEAAIADASVSDDTNLIQQQPAATAVSIEAERTELLRVGERVRRAIAAGDLTAAELELTLAEKGQKRSGAFEQIAAPLRDEIADARGRQEAQRRRAEKLRLLLQRGYERLDAAEFAEARVAFEAALDVDQENAEAAEGISRADAGLAWQAAEAVRAAQAAELTRAGAELLARGEATAAAGRAREALALQGESAEAAALLAAAEAQVAAAAAAEERRREAERRALAAAEEERRRAELEAERERRRHEAAVAEERKRQAEIEAAERRRAEAAAAEARRREEEAAARERRQRELAEELEGLFARAALAKAEKLLSKAERELGSEAFAPWRERLNAEREAQAAAEERELAAAEAARLAAEEEKRAAQEAKRTAEAAKRAAAEEERARAKEAAEREREAKRAAAAEAARAKEEERTRAASAKADLARARSLEASTGGEVQSASFASAKLTDPKTLKWVASAAAGLAVVGIALWLALGRKEQAVTATSSGSAPSEPEASAPADPSATTRPAVAPPQNDPRPAPEPSPETAPPSRPAAAAAVPEPTLEPPTDSPAGPSPLELAQRAARERLAAGDRRGALSALRQAQRLAPGDPDSLALLGEMRRNAERELAAVRQRALSAGADRFAVATLREAERVAGRMSSVTAPDAAVEAAWQANELFAEAATEARARAEQQAAAAAAAVPVAPAPSLPAPPSRIEPSPAPAPSTGAAAPPAVTSGPYAGAARGGGDASAEIRAALERYRAAYEALDAKALASVWALDAAAQSQIARAFSGYNSLSMLFDSCNLEVAGDAATARCRVTQRIDVKVGSDLRSTQEVTFALRRDGDRWLIRSRSAK